MLRRTHSTRSSQRQRGRRRQIQALERLEPRCVPTTAWVAGGVLNVVGTPGDDTIILEPHVGAFGYVDPSKFDVYSLNPDQITYTIWTFNALQIESFFVRGGAGNDRMSIASIEGYPSETKTAVIWGEDGDDEISTEITGRVTLDGGAGNDNLAPVFGYLGTFGDYSGPAVLIGGSGDDSIIARAKDRVLNSPGGDQDSISAIASFGDETIVITEFAVTLNGNAWIDRNAEDRVTVAAGYGNDTIHGSNLPDTINGGPGNDLIYGSYGDDDLYGAEGSNTIYGGDGNDGIRATEDGANAFYGGLGNDTIGFAYADDYIDGGFGEDLCYLIATDGDDIIDLAQGTITTSGQFHVWFYGFLYEGIVVEARAGNDLVFGSDGRDQIGGGAGADTVYGNGGDDSIIDGDFVPGAQNELHGGPGDDYIIGNGGLYRVYAGDGDDFVDTSGGVSYIELGPGDDSHFGSGFSDTVYGGDGNDHLAGFGGNDFLYGGAGDDGIDAGEGDDYVDGSYGNDFFLGGEGNDSILGGDGNDLFYAQDVSGNDTLDGGAGDDRFITAGGLDVIVGGFGNDSWEFFDAYGDSAMRVFGPNGTPLLVQYLTAPNGPAIGGPYGTSIETFTFDAAEGNDWIDLNGLVPVGTYPLAATFHGGEGDDTMFGSAYDDYLDGSSGTNVIDGRAGNDTIYGGEGNDSLSGGAGNDYIYGYDGNDLIQGGDGNDSLNGSTGNDTLQGGNGNDLLDGGGGIDTLDGQAGTDRVAFFGNGGASTFTLTDTSISATGMSPVTLASIESAALTGGPSNDTFNLGAWSGTATLTGAAGSDTLNVNRSTSTTPIAFALTNSQLTVTGAGAIALSGIEIANLTGGSAADSINVTGWTGTGTMKGGAGSDTISSTKNADFTLTNTSLAVAGNGTLTLAAIEVANLTGGAGANTFTVGAWTGSGTLDGQAGADTVSATRNGNFTLTDTSLTVVGVFSFANIEAASIKGGTAANTFNVGDWIGAGALQNVTLTGGGGSDKLIANKSTSSTPIAFTLAGTTAAGTVSIDSGAGPKTLNTVAIGAVSLIGGAADDSFDTGAWAGTATVTGGTGQDRVIANRSASTTAVNFTVTTTSLTANGAGAVTLSTVELAVLTGGSANDTFTLSGWTGGGSLFGGAGKDTVVVSRNANMNLTDTALTIGSSVALSSVEAAKLTGGAAANTFTLTGWTGNATLTGGGGNDRVVVTADLDMKLTDTVLSVGTVSWSLSAINSATLTGGTSPNRLNAAAYTGAVTLDGGDGDDILVGGAGNDSLIGGAGRDLMIGGLGRDTLIGGNGDDLLIAGATNYDTKAAALDAILAAWTSADTYAIRISKLTLGTIPGGYKLTSATVTNDGLADRLTGSADQDWFVVFAGDVITDQAADETKTLL